MIFEELYATRVKEIKEKFSTGNYTDVQRMYIVNEFIPKFVETYNQCIQSNYGLTDEEKRKLTKVVSLKELAEIAGVNKQYLDRFRYIKKYGTQEQFN